MYVGKSKLFLIEMISINMYIQNNNNNDEFRIWVRNIRVRYVNYSKIVQFYVWRLQCECLLLATRMTLKNLNAYMNPWFTSMEYWFSLLQTSIFNRLWCHYQIHQEIIYNDKNEYYIMSFSQSRMKESGAASYSSFLS